MKVAIVINDTFDAWNFRKNLIEVLIDRGIEVTVVSPGGPFVSKLIALGATHYAIPMHRFVNPLRDIRLFVDLYRAFRFLKPDIVHTMTIKPNTYGAIAAWLAGVPKTLALVCGAGNAFSKSPGWRQAILRSIASWLYWVAGKTTERVWFLNPDDRSLFVERRLIRPHQAVLTRGCGINIDHYSPQVPDAETLIACRNELKLLPSTTVVLLVMLRIIWSKGVKEFVEASEIVRRRGLQVKFILVGRLDPGTTDAVPEEYIRSNASSHFMHVDFRPDIKPITAIADVVTLPSYYPEGVPRVLLEALAMGKPIVTTDSVGCREVVDEGKNGFLLPIRDSAALASAVEKLCRDSSLRSSFGRHSRAKAEAEFEDSIVMNQVMKNLYGFDN